MRTRFKHIAHVNNVLFSAGSLTEILTSACACAHVNAHLSMPAEYMFITATCIPVQTSEGLLMIYIRSM
jgi:hypothetical protein